MRTVSGSKRKTGNRSVFQAEVRGETEDALPAEAQLPVIPHLPLHQKMCFERPEAERTFWHIGARLRRPSSSEHPESRKRDRSHEHKKGDCKDGHCHGRLPVPPGP